MKPWQPLRRTARDQVWRTPVGRPIYPQIRVKTWSDPKPASASEAESASTSTAVATITDADAAPGPKRNRAVRTFLIVMICAVGVNFGAVVAMVGSSVVQEVLRMAGWAEEPPMEAALRKQAVAISQLDATVETLNAAVAGLTARADSVGDREQSEARHTAEIDAALGDLRTSLNEVRAGESWRKPVAELVAAVAKARGDIVGLRASLDDVGRPRQPEVVAIRTRIDRLEQAMVQHNLLGPIRGSIQEPAARPRPLASREIPVADGHIIDLTPAR